MILPSPWVAGTQSAGGLTCTKWKGKPIAKARIYENKSASPKQVFQRERFKFVKDLGKIFGNDYLEPIWKYFERKTTYVNEYLSFNIPLQPVFVDKDTPFSGDPESIYPVKGSLEPLAGIYDAQYAPGDGSTSIFWNSSIVGNGQPTDVVYLIVVDTINKVRYVSGAVTRSSNDVVMNIPAGLDPNDLLLCPVVLQDQADGSTIYGDARFYIPAAA